MDRVATPFRQQAAHCRTLAEMAPDERVRALPLSMAQM